MKCMENNKMKGSAAIEIEIDKHMINNSIQKVISSSIKSYNIESRVHQEIKNKLTKSVNKAIENGSFYDSLAKNVLSQIDQSVIISKIDIKELQEMIAEKIAIKLVSKITSIQ